MQKLFKIFFLTFIMIPLSAEQFLFKYTEGHAYRILSIVEEDIIINHQKKHHSTIVNRIHVNEQKVNKNGTGTINASFMTTENTSQNINRNSYVWQKEYFSEFERDKYGKYTISEDAFMPVVRDVPVFPNRDIKIGDTWQYEGKEAHDLQTSFGIEKPFIIPFTALYTYKGTENVEGKNLHLITVEYTLFYDSPSIDPQATMYPLNTMGYSKQQLYWDNENGILHHYNEIFRIILEMNTGDVIEYRGTAHAEVTNTEKLNTDDTRLAIEKKIRDLGIENTQVKKGERGLTISLENIQFEAESANLKESEKIKLQKIGEILKSFSKNDLLIVGHTALAGTKTARKKLSEERASVVADYLADLGVKKHEELFTQGLGATQPIAPNDTTENKSKNRRVEIIILDK